MTMPTSTPSLTINVPVTLSVCGIEAYDREAAVRHVERDLQEVRRDVERAEIDLGFADGLPRDAFLAIPVDLEGQAELVGGQEGDPNGVMEHGLFDVTVPLSVKFSLEGGAISHAEAIGRAEALLRSSALVRDGVQFDTVGTVSAHAFSGLVVIES